MSTNVELSEMTVTRAETFLALVLAVFLLIGGTWAYAQPLDRGDEDRIGFAEEQVQVSSPDRPALDRHDAALRDLGRAERAEDSRRQDLELAREDYRTPLDAGRPAERLERAYPGDGAVPRVQRASPSRLSPLRGLRERPLASGPSLNVLPVMAVPDRRHAASSEIRHSAAPLAG